VGGLIKHADFPGITDYVLQVLPGRRRGVPEEKGVLAEGGTAVGGFHFRDLWARRARMHEDLSAARRRFHQFLSSYLAISRIASSSGILVVENRSRVETIVGAIG
jgi:hypothetical protein